MRQLGYLLILIGLVVARPAQAALSIWCSPQNGELHCSAGTGPTFQIADKNAEALCARTAVNCERKNLPGDQACVAVARPISDPSKQEIATDATVADAQRLAVESCARAYGESCQLRFSACDPDALNRGFHIPAISTLFSLFGEIGTGISFGVGVILILFLYTQRGLINNFFIHANLPAKLPVYGEDIQCLFKRTQRVNWYGRTVFGFVINLAMTHQQLIDVRKYWLGRVIAFDSLRRHRQNELAKMHLQLAATVKSEPKDKKPLSQLWATIKTVLFVLFYLIRAVFSLLLGFLFLRVSIAKLIRGAVVESYDLVLLLQAKEAIEQSAAYLKEYLATANTFDGRDEVYEPE